MAKAAARKTNWFAIWTSVIVAVIVIGAGVAVVVGNSVATSPGTAPAASNLDKDSGALLFGEGKNRVETYIDFQCPACNQFEGAYGEQLAELADNNDITLAVHPVAILDRYSMGTNYSSRSANAYYCVADTDSTKLQQFATTLFANQPAENTEGLTDEQIVGFAKDVGVDIATCQEKATFAKFVTWSTKKLPTNPATGSSATPTIVIDDEYQQLATIGASPTFFTDKFGAATSTQSPAPDASASPESSSTATPSPTATK
jgi:protein-disulfide isomerase